MNRIYVYYNQKHQETGKWINWIVRKPTNGKIEYRTDYYTLHNNGKELYILLEEC